MSSQKVEEEIHQRHRHSQLQWPCFLVKSVAISFFQVKSALQKFNDSNPELISGGLSRKFENLSYQTIVCFQIRQ